MMTDKRLKYVAKICNGRDYKTVENLEGSYPVIGSGGQFAWADNFMYNKPSVLLGRKGTVDKPLYVDFPFWTVDTMYYTEINENKVIPKYLYYLSTTIDFKQFQYGSAVPSMTQKDLSNISFYIPSTTVQKEILSYLDCKTAQIDSIIADKEKMIELLKEKRQAIISEAVTRGLDPSVPMKDSGVDWIGEVPAHWEIKPLFTVAFENKAKNSGNQCANLLSLSYGKIIKKDIDTNFGLLPESFETYQIVEDGYTILRLTDLQNDKRSLRSGFVSEKGIITSAYVGLIPANNVDGLFLSDLLHAYDLMKIFYSLGNGVRQSMNYKDLKRLPILLPPKSEQKLISNYLRNKTAEIDDLISTAEQQVSLFKEYRQSVISEAVTGKVAIS